MIAKALTLALLVCIYALIFTTSPTHAFEYQHLYQFGSQGSKAGSFSEPQGIGVDQATGDVYLADKGNFRVDKFDSGGHFISAWGWGVADGLSQSEVCTVECQSGLQGGGQGQLSNPIAIAIDNSHDSSSGDVYVADISKNSVEKFESDGHYLYSLSEGKTREFTNVYGVAVDAGGNVWVYDSSGEVYQFSENGIQIQQWNTFQGASPGFAVDSDQSVYTVRECLCTEKFSSFGEDLGELDPDNERATGLVIDMQTKRLFDDQATFIAKYNDTASPPTSPMTTFGEGFLQDGTGIGVDPNSSKVYVADAATDTVQVFGPLPPGSPQIGRILATEVATTSAGLRAMVYTGQSDTNYHFEYGSNTSYGNNVPLNGADIGSGLEDVDVSNILTGLSPDTVYHYRVVASNVFGTDASADHTFETFALPNPMLPDKRGYELVSPLDKNDGDIGFLGGNDTRASPTGQAVTYASLASFGTSQSAELVNQYISTRGPDGWTTQGISPPANFTGTIDFSPPYESFNPILTMGVLAWRGFSLTPEASPDYRNLYLRRFADNSYQLITTITPPNGSESHFVGASKDYNHVVFQADDALTEGAIENTQNIYEWFSGKLLLISILPGSTVGTPGSGAGNGIKTIQGAVSSDGSLIYWTDGDGQLYVREQGIRTTKVNASQRLSSLGDGVATFLGATPDGGQVFFGDETALTDGSIDHGGLYEFEPGTRKLVDLTPDGEGDPGLEGILGYSNDGSSVYFVATGSLLEGARAGQPNLYLSHDGSLSLVATLSSKDSSDWASEPGSRHAEVSTDGRHVVFVSDSSLTGYDNTDANNNRLDNQVFIYDAEHARLQCVSCNPSGAAPIGPSSIPASLNGTYNSRYLSLEGNRVFFDSYDDLSPRDINGVEDLYEWEQNPECGRSEDCLYLISDGIGESSSLFADASEDGNDVFFTTRSRLVPEDLDDNIDLYDARVDGGMTTPPLQAECSGEACLGPLGAAPGLEDPLTAEAGAPSEGNRISTGNVGFTVARPGSKNVQSFFRTGRLTLYLQVPRSGKATGTVAALLQGHMERIAYGSARAQKAGKIVLVLKMSKWASKVLAARRRLKASITIAFSGSTQAKRFGINFYNKGVRP